ncbi:aKG-HExxH-type peptide beta-hydroxylase [Comamonas testosteroni]|uniref:aKG-HExxH-type peptide beta-hydroxylase n=1 Tax=Comamonas testosteroni TaxID=285 RepID=UPI003B3AE068
MLERAAAVKEYRAATSRFDAVSVSELAPLVCRSILLDDGESVPLVEVLPGEPSSIVRLPANVWDQLPLQGLQPVLKTQSLHASLQHFVRTFGALWPSRQHYIRDWITAVHWVEQDPEKPGPLLTSSTFPALPHCAFLSTKAKRHIPPNIVLEADSGYALFENLYHEALHQQLSTTILFTDSIASAFSSSTCTKISVPWRGSSWEPDRVLHATFVYSGLLRLRREAAIAENQVPMELDLMNAVKEAHQALTYLIEQFTHVRPAFSDAGQQLVDEVLHCAMSALDVR